MMLGKMIGMEAGTIVMLDDLQAFFVERRDRALAAIEMIEDAELQIFHATLANNHLRRAIAALRRLRSAWFLASTSALTRPSSCCRRMLAVTASISGRPSGPL